jgi:alpha-L-fucosidase 2
MPRSLLARSLTILATAAAALPAPASPPQGGVARYNVVWDSPSRDSSGSMPIGNGDLALNVWAEPTGDLLFYIAKSDAVSENGQFLKLGRVRVSLSPNPFTDGAPFRQELRLSEGEIVVSGGAPASRTTLTVWVDANRPVIHVEASSDKPVHLTAALELWRTKARTAAAYEEASIYELSGGPEPAVIDPDTVRPAQANRLLWYHRNERSCYPGAFRNQHLEALLARFPDPLLHRTFGGVMSGPGLAAVSDVALKSTRAAVRHRLSIYALTAQTGTPREFEDRLLSLARRTATADIEVAREQHRRWWQAFWDRSSIDVTSPTAPDEALTVSRGYALSRWMSACAGRGSLPLKFNGSLFTVDAEVTDPRTKERHVVDADYRAWGGNFWFQNERLLYWPLLASGDFDLMEPWFAMYRKALPVTREIIRTYYGHAGAFFYETMFFWGTANNTNFGWGNRSNETENTYIRNYRQGGIELVAMMLDRWDYGRDTAFARATLLPIAEAVTTYFDLHYRRDAAGKIRFEPAQSLETWHTAVNPLPEIAGLRYVLPRLIALPESLTSNAQRAGWRRLLGELPAVPVSESGGKRRLAPAETYSDLKNAESPELYAVYPYKLYGLGKPDIEAAMNAYEVRRYKESRHCWWQHGIWAAHLGLADQARHYVMGNFTALDGKQRFPAFWKPSPDWVPDIDNSGVGMITLQSMLMQSEGRRITLLPAWPEGWSATFKLHAPYNTTVEGRVQNGKLVSYSVTPAGRKADVSVAGMRRQ